MPQAAFRADRLLAARATLPLLGLVLLLTACAAPPVVPPRPATRPAVDVIAAEVPELPSLSEVVLYLDEVEVLTLRGATDRSVDPPVAYQFYAEATATRPAGTARRAFQLRPAVGDRQPIRCEITEADDGKETSINLSSSSGSSLPDIQLVGNTERMLLPVRLAPAEPDRITYAISGPAVGTFFNGFFDPVDDWAIAMEGRVSCRTAADSIVVTVRSAEPRADRQTVLTLRSRRRYLQDRFHLPGYPPPPVAPVAAAASWMPLEPGTAADPDEPARHARWMAMNLEPYGAGSILTRAAAVRRRERIVSAEDGSEVPETGTLGFLATMDVPLSRGMSIASWAHFEETTRQMAGGYWTQGICAPAGASLVGVGEPLSIEQARAFVSVIGLSGRTPIMGERMYRLAEERVDPLRRIIPALPARAVDLFAREQPGPLWNLRVVREFGRWDILGVFNPSSEGRVETVSSAALLLDDEPGTYAMYDVWKDRLLKVTEGDVTLHLPPTSCRVLSIHRVEFVRPTLLGSNRHLTCGGVDLHDVRWDVESATLTGESDVVAHDPYELRILLPPGEHRFEVLDAHSGAGPASLRRCGDLRLITIDSDTTRRLTWTVHFRREKPAPQEPLLAPDRLSARQNTRGILLSWSHRDERTPWYRIYRDGEPIVDVEDTEYQDSSVLYNRAYAYAVTAVDPAGRESPRSASIVHQTPIPASANLTVLAPLSSRQDHLELAIDRSVVGTPLRVAGSRLYRGLGTHANSRIVYFLGGGYDLFTATIGIDDAARERGSVVFEVRADGETLYTGKIIRGGERARGFSLRVSGRRQLELIVTDGGDGTDFDFADWGNPYLRVLPEAGRPEVRPALGPSRTMSDPAATAPSPVPIVPGP